MCLLSRVFLGLLPESSFASIEHTYLTTADVALNEICRHLASERQCHDLAAYLLERSPGGGIAFIKRHTASNAPIDWLSMARAILLNWCEDYPRDSTTTNLLQILRYKLNAQAAANCLTEQFSCHGDGEVGFSRGMYLLPLAKLSSHRRTASRVQC